MCEGPLHTYLRSSALAILKASELVPSNVNLHIVTPSQQVVTALTTRLAYHERSGWLNLPAEARALRATTAALRSRAGETTFTFVTKKAIREWEDLKETKDRAQVAAELGNTFEVEWNRYVAFDRPGLTITGIKQRLAYQAIRDHHNLNAGPRRRTEEMLDRIKKDIRERYDTAPDSKQIWRGIHNKDISKNVQVFLWRAIHSAHKIGAYFAKMPQPWKGYGTCETCGVTESIEHILTECPESRQEQIWSYVENFMGHRIVDFSPSLGTILGCANVPCAAWGGGRDGARERSYRIIVSESAYLIWKIRCEKKIGHAEDPNWRISDAEVRKRWDKMVSTRYHLDHKLTNKQRYGRRALDRHEVWATWRDLADPIANSIAAVKYGAGVLVGRESQGSPEGVG
ncbi:hypothetical protein AURDEDRAFT_56341 [Auricularia subglabra TFB-10046 SS5]|nr:hypothetical protein AURDEDRAFT_56341 [Auricularia subglabra TFB-10046 SS5]